MPLGLVVSVLLHAGLLALALLGYAGTKPLKLPDEVPVEVSIVSTLDLELRQKKGDSLAKLEEAAQSDGKVPTPKDAAKPKPVRAVEPPAPPPPPAAAEPPPPPPEPVKAPEPPPAPKPPDQVAALIEKVEPPVPVVPDGPTFDEKKKLEEKLAEQQRQDEARAKAEAEARVKAEAKRKADAEAKKRADDKKKADDKKRAEDKRKADELAKKKQFDASKIAELLNKVPDQPSSSQGADTPPVTPTTAKGPTAGTKSGTDTVNRAKAEQLLNAILNSALKECWSKPLAGGGVPAPAVKVKWNLNQDGTLAGEPKVIQSDRNSPLADQAERAAIRAVQTCVPFQLPAEHYNLWRVIDWNFNPNQQ